MSVTNLGGEQPAMRPKQNTKSCRSEREKKGEKIGLERAEKNKTKRRTFYNTSRGIHASIKFIQTLSLIHI